MSQSPAECPPLNGSRGSFQVDGRVSSGQLQSGNSKKTIHRGEKLLGGAACSGGECQVGCNGSTGSRMGVPPRGPVGTLAVYFPVAAEGESDANRNLPMLPSPWAAPMVRGVGASSVPAEVAPKSDKTVRGEMRAFALLKEKQSCALMDIAMLSDPTQQLAAASRLPVSTSVSIRGKSQQ